MGKKVNNFPQLNIYKWQAEQVEEEKMIKEQVLFYLIKLLEKFLTQINT